MPLIPQSHDVASVAARVAQLAGRRGTREGKLEAGRLVFEACYRGDAVRFASRGRGSVSLRALAAEPETGLSVTTLWRLARAHVAAASLPPELAGCLSLSQLARLAAVEVGGAREAAALQVAERIARGEGGGGGQVFGPACPSNRSRQVTRLTGSRGRRPSSGGWS